MSMASNLRFWKHLTIQRAIRRCQRPEAATGVQVLGNDGRRDCVHGNGERGGARLQIGDDLDQFERSCRGIVSRASLPVGLKIDVQHQ